MFLKWQVYRYYKMNSNNWFSLMYALYEVPDLSRERKKNKNLPKKYMMQP